MHQDLLALFSNCVIVKGVSRATICDLQRNKVYCIPNALAYLFKDTGYFNFNELLSTIDYEEKTILEEYINFLKLHELAFCCSRDEMDSFPRLSEEWLFPSHISNCVLDTVSKFDYFDKYLVSQLEELCCNFIQFRFYGFSTIEHLERLMHPINNSQIKSVEILLPFQSDNPTFDQEIISFVEQNGKISNLIIYNAHTNCFLKDGEYGMGLIIKSKSKIESVKHCGVIDQTLFSINIPHYTESLHHNTCLNRKISIDVDGNIKNCPSMKESFGNIKDTTLAEAIKKPGFKKYWNLAKDQISVCKDCEFRHICTDCRAYLEDPEDDTSKPLKCGYDPYTCEWEEWSINPIKQKAILFYGMQQ